MLRFLVHVLFTFYIQGVLKFLNKFGGLRVTGLEWPRGFQEVKVPRFIYILYIYIKVKQSRYRPGVTQRVPGS